MYGENTKLMPEAENNVFFFENNNQSETTAQIVQQELIELLKDINNKTLLLGSKLILVQEEKLHKHWGYSSYTSWLKEFSRASGIKMTKLWDTKKIVKMLEATSTDFSEVNNATIKGLYQIARLYKKNNNQCEVKKLIRQLNDKEITDKDIAKLVNPSETKGFLERIKLNYKTLLGFLLGILPALSLLFFSDIN